MNKNPNRKRSRQKKWSRYWMNISLIRTRGEAGGPACCRGNVQSGGPQQVLLVRIGWPLHQDLLSRMLTINFDTVNGRQDLSRRSSPKNLNSNLLLEILPYLTITTVIAFVFFEKIFATRFPVMKKNQAYEEYFDVLGLPDTRACCPLPRRTWGGSIWAGQLSLLDKRNH
jgi:hypothetical protein